MLKTFLIYKLTTIKNMSWSSNDNNSPWGKKPSENKKRSSNGSGGDSYNDDYLKSFQDKLKNMFPKNNPTSLGIVVVILLFIWTLSGFYRVGTDEQGVVTRFGEYVRTTNSYKEKQTLVAAPCHGMETNSQYHWEVIPDGNFIKLRHRYYRQCIQFQ